MAEGSSWTCKAERVDARLRPRWSSSVTTLRGWAQGEVGLHSPVVVRCDFLAEGVSVEGQGFRVRWASTRFHVMPSQFPICGPPFLLANRLCHAVMPAQG